MLIAIKEAMVAINETVVMTKCKLTTNSLSHKNMRSASCGASHTKCRAGTVTGKATLKFPTMQSTGREATALTGIRAKAAPAEKSGGSTKAMAAAEAVVPDAVAGTT